MLYASKEKYELKKHHFNFFSSFFNFFLAEALPEAACFANSSAYAFFTLLSFSICFLLVGILFTPPSCPFAAVFSFLTGDKRQGICILR